MNSHISPAQDRSGARDQATPEPGGNANPLRVLVVGRLDDYAGLVWDALSARHPRIDRALDVDVALNLVARARYDLIVVLLPMPGLDGAKLCRQLRVYDESVPLCVLAAGGTVDVIGGFEAGADAYLVEPLHVEELRARLTALLRRHDHAHQPAPASAAQPDASAAQPDVGVVTPPADTPRSHLPKAIAAMWGSGRGKLTRVVAVAALIGAGVLGDRVLQAPQPSSIDAASAAAAPATTGSTSATGTDAATEQAFAVASPSVVYVDNVGVGSGSGVIYDSRGDIVTNAHVVANAQSLRVTLKTGKTYAARLVGSDTADDLAVIRVNASGLPAAHFAGSGSYQVAQTVLAIGNPLDLQQSVTSGLISALGRTVQEGNGAYLPNAIQTSAPINPGNSGGALVDLSGAVVGIPTLEATDPQNNNGGAAQGIGFAVPSSRVTFVAHQLIATGRVEHTGRAYLGVGATDASSAQSSPFGGNGFGNGGNGPTIDGALVQNVASGSPADRAGIQQGDIITAANGRTVSGEDDLLAALARSKPGATMTLTLNRNGSTLTVHARLGELSAS